MSFQANLVHQAETYLNEFNNLMKPAVSLLNQVYLCFSSSFYVLYSLTLATHAFPMQQ
jgi:hypothetical protein